MIHIELDTSVQSRGGPKSARRRRGSALPAILALSVGVGALATGFASQDLREHQRESWERERLQAYLDAWAQMEICADIVNNADYDAGTGENIALRDASARADAQFVDRDGRVTGVRCEPDGGSGAGFFRLVSERNVGEARCRITALIRSRQSFADFDYFVNSHDLGISGGVDASSRHADAPDGDIHSNRQMLLYFPDRHFVKPVTASQGFQFVSGAQGPNDPQGDPQNNWFWGPTNDAAPSISGLTSIDVAAIGARADNLLNLNGEFDFAKIKLKGTTATVEHWELGHNGWQDVTRWVEQFHYEDRQRELMQPVVNTATRQVAVGEWRQVSVLGPVAHQRLTAEAWTETVTRTRQEARQRWIAGGGGGATGGGGGSGGVGYWETYYVTVEYTETISHPATYETYYVDEWHDVWQWFQTGTQTVTDTWTTYQSYSPQRFETYQVRVSDGWTAQTAPEYVWISEHLVATHNVGTNGTIFVNGRIELMPMSQSSDGFDVHTLDGSLTLASNDDVRIRDSVVYAKRDANGAWQSAYLNGADRTQEYVPNPAYTGRSVLGIVATNDVEIRSDVPDQAEVNGTILARDGEFRVRGVTVNSDGTVTTSSTGSFVKQSLRRLGGVITNQRPVTTYVDSNNAVTRGFIYTKSVYDVRQRTNPPRAFPTVNRPRIMATLVREIN